MTFVLGVDEAGRGPLAGPVAVGVIAVDSTFDILAAFPGLNDSKKLSEKKREALHALLIEEGKKGNVRAKVCFSSEKSIDRRGIAAAVREALIRGVRALAPVPRGVHILLDGSLKAPPEYSQKTIIGGDASEPAIMLASIAAKVARDRLMVRLAAEYPHYGFEKHKGYGTKAHYEALQSLGLSPIHRRTFIHL
ncbi:MAG: ribonuclease HII [Minisyncoccia bacterium]